MTTEHFIVFVGATAPLSSELLQLQKMLHGVKIVAPAMKKKQVGVNLSSSREAISKLHSALSDGRACTDAARLSVWFYEPDDPSQFDEIWAAFGHCAWIETIPKQYNHKVQQTREYIEARVSEVLPLLHLLSCATFGQRKSSPLTLPLRNFRSNLSRDLRRYWYNELNENQLKNRIKTFKQQYSQMKNREKSGFVDDSQLVFAPAEDEALHGQVHPTGSTPKSFTCGRFRYGVALFPGFHFDVTPLKSATIQRELITCDGGTRQVRSEARRYMNIFPNDHLLPEL